MTASILNLSLHRCCKLISASSTNFRRQFSAIIPLKFPNMNNFHCNSKINIDKVGITKYKSKLSGLTICVGDVTGPLVNGHFCVATESFDDNGWPHTLEHLVFLGSKKYPFKGILDKLANLCLANGTNACTEIDSTYYTIETAGSEGFLNILPIYLDHILNPTLNDAGFITEVYHIDGKGEDSGVVYCEMEGVESMEYSRADMALRRALYPKPSGYGISSGGLLEDIRSSLSIDKIRKAHGKFYNMDNLCLIVSGHINHNALLERIAAFERDNLVVGKRQDFTRPWISPVPPPQQSGPILVEFPSDDESTGSVILAWRGPACLQFDRWTLTTILMDYFTFSSASPLSQQLIETPSPFCTNIDPKTNYYRDGHYFFNCANVPYDKLHSIHDEVFQVLRSYSVDLVRMEDCLRRLIREAHCVVEDSPHEKVAMEALQDFLYGETAEDLSNQLQDVERMESYQGKDEAFWVDKIKEVFDESRCFTLVVRPSEALAKANSVAKSERIEARKAQLGEEGLNRLKVQLEAAVEENEIEAPKELLSLFQVPGTDSISFHKTVNLDLKNLGFQCSITNIQSNFVSLNLIIDTKAVQDDLRWVIPMYTELLFESPLRRGSDGIQPYEEVVAQLSADTVAFGASLGLHGSRFHSGRFPQAVCLAVKVHRDNLTLGVRWLRRILLDSEFTEERVAVIAAQIRNSVSEFKRNGPAVCSLMGRELSFTPGSNVVTANVIKQEILMGCFEKNPKRAVELLNDLSKKIIRPSNLFLHLVGDLNETVGETINKELSMFIEHSSPAKVDSLVVSGLKTANYLCPGGFTSVIGGLASIDSSYLLLSVPLFSDYQHPDLPALLVACETLDTIEGPLWREIRGRGFAYGYRTLVKLEQGLLTFDLYRSSQLVSAYRVARGVFESVTRVSELELQGAKSGVIFAIVSKETTPSEAGALQLSHLLCGVPPEYQSSLITAVNNVTSQQVLRVVKEYLLQLFEPEGSWCSVTTNPDNVDSIVHGMAELGRRFTNIGTLEEAYRHDFTSLIS